MSRPEQRTAVFLDMIGGIAGDMFIAAATDLDRSLEAVCDGVFQAIEGRPDGLVMTFFDHSAEGRFGRRFRVDAGAAASGYHGHLGFSDAIRIVRQSKVSSATKVRSENIFEYLAKSEGAVHGVDPGEVEFHEIGGWDSIVDIMLSAAIIEELGSVRWLCSSVPLGRGSVQSAHGRLPVPAPATVKLLEGFVVYQDEFPGERVTPTGAAILRHLAPEQFRGMPVGRLVADGCGYGSSHIEGLANVLRIYTLFGVVDYSRDSVAVLEFEVDDQSPEDLAIGLEALRACGGVLDVVQAPVYGKQSRLAIQVRALVRPEALAAAVDLCLSATSTIGARWHMADRAVLDRAADVVSVGERALKVKRVRRPDGELTAKIESADLQDACGSFAKREALRSRAAGLVRNGGEEGLEND